MHLQEQNYTFIVTAYFISAGGGSQANRRFAKITTSILIESY